MGDHAPLISIIVPVYNTARWLPRCLDSIQNQTFTDWECILSDDGSTDESGVICDEYAAKDPRFRVIHKENGGVSSARNAGLDKAAAPVILFADADDMLAPDLMEQACRLLKEDPEAMIIWGLSMNKSEFDASLSVPRTVTRSTLNAMSWNSALFANVYTQTYSAERIRRHHLRFDTALGSAEKVGEDHDFVLRYCALEKDRRDFPLFLINQPLYYYEQGNPNSIMHQLDRMDDSTNPRFLPDPEPGSCQSLLETLSGPGRPTPPSEEKALGEYLHHFLRAFAFGIWSAGQLGEPLPSGLFSRPELTGLLDLSKKHRFFTVYYLPFRLHMAKFSARLYAWEEEYHINYWRAREILYRLFFRGWKK